MSAENVCSPSIAEVTVIAGVITPSAISVLAPNIATTDNQR